MEDVFQAPKVAAGRAREPVPDFAASARAAHAVANTTLQAATTNASGLALRVVSARRC